VKEGAGIPPDISVALTDRGDTQLAAAEKTVAAEVR
jgi:hypothetical protein